MEFTYVPFVAYGTLLWVWPLLSFTAHLLRDYTTLTRIVCTVHSITAFSHSGASKVLTNRTHFKNQKPFSLLFISFHFPWLLPFSLSKQQWLLLPDPIASLSVPPLSPPPVTVKSLRSAITLRFSIISVQFWIFKLDPILRLTHPVLFFNFCFLRKIIFSFANSRTRVFRCESTGCYTGGSGNRSSSESGSAGCDCYWSFQRYWKSNCASVR